MFVVILTEHLVERDYNTFTIRLQPEVKTWLYDYMFGYWQLEYTLDQFEKPRLMFESESDAITFSLTWL